LHVSVPPSIYDYYRAKIPPLADDSEYSTLVTPNAFKSIAENLRNLTRDKPRSDEEFANAVLMLVHQIPYSIGDVKYPIETLVENSGKCDTLSLLAASIMKAGGLDVVLLHFKEVRHINVGIYLPYEPHGTWWWQSSTGYEFDGKKYWIAECTPATEWKVGDVPPLLAGEKPWIISLENTEKSSPADVSSKLDGPLTPSFISINLSSDSLSTGDEERMLKISGSISPGYPYESIVVYFSQNGTSYNAYRTKTNYWGEYSFNWNLTSTGTYYIRTSWSGASDYASADSETLTVFVGFPRSLIQFEGPDYYYNYGHAAVATHELRIRQGVEEFLSVQLSGTGVLLTGDFIILRSGQTITVAREGKIPVPIEKMVIPKGTQPLRLPDDIEQTTNNKFGFILRHSDGNNYSLEVRGWDDYEMLHINQFGGNRTTFINASMGIRENTWYKVLAKLSEDEIIAELQDINGTFLERTATTDDAKNINELVMLIANNTDRAVVFKDFKVETLNQYTQLPEGTKEIVNSCELLVPCVALTILLAATLAAVVYVKKRKSRNDRLNKQHPLITFSIQRHRSLITHFAKKRKSCIKFSLTIL
jgi:hypothetical protein